MSTQIKYKDRVVVAFESGTAILHANGERLEGDLEIMSTGGGEDKFKTMVDGTISEVTAEDLQGVTKLRAYAFAGANLSKGITLPDSITAISNQAFMYTSLPNINIGDAVKTIGSSAFTGCASLAEVSIGSGVTKIDNAAFSGCTALKKITCNAVTPPTLGTNAFNNVPSDCIIYVPEDSVSAYKTATNWAARANYIFPIGSSIISFSFDGFACLADEGMTWAQWVNSSFNMHGGQIVGDYVSVMDETVVLATTAGGTDYITKDQPITARAAYYLVTSPFAVTCTIGRYEYIFSTSKTFQELIDESYGGGEFYAEDGYVGSYAVGGLLYKDGAKVPVSYQIQNGDIFTVGA